MGVVIGANLTKNSTFTQASSYATASIAPTANNLQLLVVISNALSGTTNTPTATGAGLTWTQVLSFPNSDSPTQRMTVFRALSASPSSGAVTVDFGGQNQNHFTHTIDQFSRVDVSGTNGSGAIVQSNTKEQTGSSSPSLTLSAFANANNAVYGAIFQNGSVTFTHGSNFTELASTLAAYSVESQWANNPQTTIDWTLGNTNKLEMIAIEIGAQKSGGMFLSNFM